MSQKNSKIALQITSVKYILVMVDPLVLTQKVRLKRIKLRTVKMDQTLDFFA